MEIMQKITGLVVGLVVALILIINVALPVVDDATATNGTIENPGYYYMSSDDSSEHVYTYVKSTDVLTLDGVTVATPTTTKDTTIITTGNFVARSLANDAGINLYGQGGAHVNTMTLKINNGSIDLTYTTLEAPTTTVEKSITYSGDVWMITPIDTGHVMTEYGNSTYIHTGSEATATLSGISYITNGTTYTYFTVSADISAEGLTNLKFYSIITGGELTDIVASDVSINGSAASEYTDIYKIDSVTFTATSTSDITMTGDITYTAYIVPDAVSSELSNHLDATQIAIIAVLPILLLVTCIVYAAKSIAGKEE